MKKAFVAVVASLVLATAGFAQMHSVEVDLNGVLGDGPDLINVPVSTVVPVDVWITGDGPCWWVVGLFLCNAELNLGYQSTAYFNPGGGWAFIAPLPPDANGCITLQGQNFSFDVPMCAPWKLATVQYHAAVDHTVAHLVAGPQSGVLTTGFVTSSFSNNGAVLATIEIGTPPQGTEETNWGAVKSLFR
jgi:hypothetical protein